MKCMLFRTREAACKDAFDYGMFWPASPRARVIAFRKPELHEHYLANSNNGQILNAKTMPPSSLPAHRKRFVVELI